jgi:hypothetical protein
MTNRVNLMFFSRRKTPTTSTTEALSDLMQALEMVDALVAEDRSAKSAVQGGREKPMPLATFHPSPAAAHAAE